MLTMYGIPYIIFLKGGYNLNKAKILKRLIEQKYKSVKEFSKCCNLPYTTVYTILKNGVGKANVNNIIVICRELNITVEQLYDMAGDKKEQHNIITSLGISSKDKLTDSESQLLKKYHFLDEYGKEAVDSILNVEYNRCVDINNVTYDFYSKIVDDEVEEIIKEEEKKVALQEKELV